MPFSHLNTDRSDLIAAALNGISDDPDVSAGNLSDAAMIGLILQEVDGSVAANPHLRMTQPQMLAAIANEVGGSANAGFDETEDILAKIVNAINGDSAASSAAMSLDELWAAFANAAEGGLGANIVLSASTIAEGSAAGSDVGSLSVSNGTGTYTFSITADPDNKFALNVDGVTLEVDQATNFEAATSHLVTIEADNGVDAPISQQFTITVTNVLEVTLNAITLNTDEIEEGSAEDTVVGALQGLTGGSTRSLTDTAGNRFKLSGTNIVAGPAATDFESAASHNITFRETHADGSNSPRDSVIAVTVTDIDEVAPTLSSPTVTNIGSSTADISVSTNEGNGTLWWVITEEANQPSAAQIKAGEGAFDPAADDGSQAVSGTGVQNANVSGLADVTTYWAHFMHEDAASNQSAVSTSASFETEEADTTAPTLSAPAVEDITDITATALVTTNEANGTLYMVVTESATDPSKAQIKAGQNDGGTAAVFADDHPIATTGEKSFSVTGLDAETTYYAYFMHEDAATNQSNIATVDAWETEEATAPNAATLTWVSGPGVNENIQYMIEHVGTVIGDIALLQVDDTDDTFANIEDTGGLEWDGADWVALGTPNPVGPLTDGDKWARVIIQRTGVSDSIPSNIETQTIDIAPTISTLSPVDNATGVLVGANLVATFSKNVAFHTAVSITLKKTSDNSTIEAFDETDIGTLISISGAALTINPTSVLANSTEFYVQIGATSIKNASGIFFAGISSTTAWSFTTEASGAVAYDNDTFANNVASTGTVAFTVGSGSNRALVVAIVQTTDTVNTPSGVTYNGVAMTLIDVDVSNSIWGLVNPASGAHNIVPTFTGGGQCAVAALSVTGADQTGGATTFENYNTANGTSTSASVNVTSAVGDMVFASFIDAGVVMQNNATGTDIGNNFADLGDLNGAAAIYDDGAASVTMTYTLNSSNFWSASGVSIKAA